VVEKTTSPQFGLTNGPNHPDYVANVAANESWKDLLSNVLSAWASESEGVVLSADVDGALSAAIVATKFPTRVIGIYTTTHLVLLDGATAEDAGRALWLDHDVSEPGVRCVGQHLVHHKKTDELPRREPESFNPNVWLRQAWENSFSGRGGRKRDKYPYGTCHFLADALGIDPGTEASPLAALMAHADGTWRTVVDYAPNADIWFNEMFVGSVFLEHLRESWAESSTHLAAHADVVNRLISAGVTNGRSRSKIADGLSDDLQALTGRQGVRYQPKDPQSYADKVRSLQDLVAAEVGSTVLGGSSVSSIISGHVDTPYPDRISDFDEFMMENDVFSHAFTNQRTLRYTTGIRLRP